MSTRTNIEGGTASGLLMKQDKKDQGVVTLAGDLILGVKSEPVQILDPGGTNRDIDLPPEADSEHLQFFILNEASSDESLLVKNDSGTVILTLLGVSGGTNNGRGQFVCDGVNWYGALMTKHLP